MSKRLSLTAALAVAALTAVPGASQARDCRPLERVSAGAEAVVTGTTRAVRSVGDAVVRTGDRAFGWMFHRRRT